jgi:hypothetical protein
MDPRAARPHIAMSEEGTGLSRIVLEEEAGPHAVKA